MYTNNVLSAHVHVYRPWWYYKQSFMLCRAYLVFLAWPKNEKKKNVNHKSASFVIIILLHKGLTHIHSQQMPRLHFGKSFTLSSASAWGAVCHCGFPVSLTDHTWYCIGLLATDCDLVDNLKTGNCLRTAFVSCYRDMIITPIMRWYRSILIKNLNLSLFAISHIKLFLYREVNVYIWSIYTHFF